MRLFCPQCKREYDSGYTHCYDCRVKLVPELVPGDVEAMDEREARERARPLGWKLISISIAVDIFLLMLQAMYPGTGFMLSILLYLVATAYLAGCGYVARSKGYNPALGLIGVLPVIGIVILVLLRERDISIGPPDFRPVR